MHCRLSGGSIQGALSGVVFSGGAFSVETFYTATHCLSRRCSLQCQRSLWTPVLPAGWFSSGILVTATGTRTRRSLDVGVRATMCLAQACVVHVLPALGCPRSGVSSPTASALPLALLALLCTELPQDSLLVLRLPTSPWCQ